LTGFSVIIVFVKNLPTLFGVLAASALIAGCGNSNEAKVEA